LRDVAGRVAEVASLPIEEERADLRRRHNDLDGFARPMVLMLPEGAWREMLPEEAFECTHPTAHSLERDLGTRLYYHQHMPAADNVVDVVMPSPVAMRDSGWGIKARITRPEQATGAGYYVGEPILGKAPPPKKRSGHNVGGWERVSRPR
jgi:hypothetical protein